MSPADRAQIEIAKKGLCIAFAAIEKIEQRELNPHDHDRAANLMAVAITRLRRQTGSCTLADLRVAGFDVSDMAIVGRAFLRAGDTAAA